MTNPFGSIDLASTILHEMFQSYVRAGFTRLEALELIKVTIAEQTRYAISRSTNDEEGKNGHSQD
jgi:hypothetical protein